MNSSKILNHPDLQQIITKLTSGESARDVANWLKEKYPSDREKQISYNTLNEFRKEQLNIHGAVLEDIRTRANEAKQEEDKKELKREVKRIKSYRDKINEVVDQQIDWRMKMMQLLNVIEARFEQLFDNAQNNPESWKPDYIMVSWMQTIMEMIKEIRHIEGAPDQIIQHNVTMQTIEEQSALLQEALRQTLAEIDIETSLLLMDKISENMAKLQASRNTLAANEKTFNKITNNIEALSVKVLSANNVEDEEGDKDKNGNGKK